MSKSNRLDKCKIYKVVNDVDDQFYIGYTTYDPDQALKYLVFDAMESAKCSAILDHIRKLGPDHFSTELIEEYPCIMPEEVKLRKQHWVKELNATLNGYKKPNRSHPNQPAPPPQSRHHWDKFCTITQQERVMLHRLYWRVFAGSSASDDELPNDA
jgi:hypothetical protein